MRQLAAVIAASGLAASAGQAVDPAALLFTFLKDHVEQAHGELQSGPGPFAVEEPRPECGQCVERVALDVAHRAMAKMRQKCESGSGCPHACKQLMEDPRVVMGMLTVKEHPLRMAGMFCTGKGLCEASEMEEAPADLPPDGGLMALADAADRDLATALPPPAHFPPPPPPLGHPGGRQCMRHTIHHIMDRVMDAIENVCRRRSDDVEGSRRGAFCELRKRHPEFFRGVLLAKVEPWKFARGHCAPHEEAPEPLSPFSWFGPLHRDSRRRHDERDDFHHHGHHEGDHDDFHHHGHHPDGPAGHGHHTGDHGEHGHHPEWPGAHGHHPHGPGEHGRHHDGGRKHGHGHHCGMKEVRECHRKCGADEKCHEKCPKPFDKLAKECEAHKATQDCLDNCEGLGCHLRCLASRPFSFRGAAHAFGQLGCRAWCMGNETCAADCSRRPGLEAKCRRLEEVRACHKKCGHGDPECHARCPRMFDHHRHEDAESMPHMPMPLPNMPVNLPFSISEMPMPKMPMPGMPMPEMPMPVMPMPEMPIPGMPMPEMPMPVMPMPKMPMPGMPMFPPDMAMPMPEMPMTMPGMPGIPMIPPDMPIFVPEMPMVMPEMPGMPMFVPEMPGLPMPEGPIPQSVAFPPMDGPMSMDFPMVKTETMEAPEAALPVLVAMPALAI